jgi:signal transduction histidine kinase
MGGTRSLRADELAGRAVVYALLAAAVVIVVRTDPAAGGTLSTAAATLVAFALARPLSVTLQRAVDRRFRRRRYEALRRVERFLVDVREGRAPPEGIQAVLGEALGDSTLEVCYRLPHSDLHVDGAGRVIDPRPGAARVATELVRGDASIGVLLHARSLAERPDVLRAALTAAGLPIEVARLRSELKRQLLEVEASRALLARAAENERRRVERDLHDGAQQRLVALGISLRRVQRRLHRSAAAVQMLDEAVAEVTAAVGELRALAHGVPAIGGMPPAPAAGSRR